MVGLVYHLILHMTDLKPTRGMVSYETVSTKLNAYLKAFVTKSQSFSTPYELCLSAAGCHFIKVNLAWVSIK